MGNIEKVMRSMRKSYLSTCRSATEIENTRWKMSKLVLEIFLNEQDMVHSIISNDLLSENDYTFEGLPIYVVESEDYILTLCT